MARIKKTIWTYSALAKKAMALRESDPTALDSLFGGSDTFLPCVRVHWDFGARRSNFELSYMSRDRKGQPTRQTLCRIFGNKRDGRFHTYYQFCLRPGAFPKKLVEQYLPIALPQGVRCSRSYGTEKTKCVYLRVDGTTHCVGNWIGGRVRRIGEPDMRVVLDDETGVPVPEKLWMEQRLFSTYQNAYYDLGWHREGSSSRLDWINSIRRIPGIDERATLECALHACKAAMELTSAYPSIRMMLLPAGINTGAYRTLPNGSSEKPCPLDGTSWQLPQVVLYWHDFYEESDGEAHWTTLTMTIPPHGHRDLDPTGGTSPFARVRGDQLRAYHSLIGWKPGDPLARVSKPEAAVSPAGQAPAYGQPHDFSGFENATVFWPQNRDKVLAELSSDAPKPVMKGRIKFAMRPDDVRALVEGKFVIDSLPML